MDLRDLNFEEMSEKAFDVYLETLDGDGGAKYSLQMHLLELLNSAETPELVNKFAALAEKVGSSVSDSEFPDYSIQF